MSALAGRRFECLLVGATQRFKITLPVMTRVENLPQVSHCAMIGALAIAMSSGAAKGESALIYTDWSY
jgi:hypothetical protein